MTFFVKPYQRPTMIGRFLSPFKRRTKRGPDLRFVSEHLRRDIGLLDGRLTRGRDRGRSL